MDNCIVTIGLPVFNCEKTLPFTIQSIINQDLKKWKLIIIDDGSTDTSLAIARSYASKDSRILVLSDGKNKRLPSRLNEITSLCDTPYLARMDSDDIMFPSRLSEQIDFLDKNFNFDLVATGKISIDNNNKVRGYNFLSSIKINISNPIIKNPIVHPSILGRTEWFKRNPYSEKYFRCEDYELWVRANLKKDFKIAILPKPLIFYREIGNLSIQKILNSYDQGYEIKKKYYGFNLKFFVRYLFKRISITSINALGLLQSMDKIRNKSIDSKSSDFEKYSKILNDAIKE